jgi:hypothetical protein
MGQLKNLSLPIKTVLFIFQLLSELKCSPKRAENGFKTDRPSAKNASNRLRIANFGLRIEAQKAECLDSRRSLPQTTIWGGNDGGGVRSAGGEPENQPPTQPENRKTGQLENWVTGQRPDLRIQSSVRNLQSSIRTPLTLVRPCRSNVPNSEKAAAMTNRGRFLPVIVLVVAAFLALGMGDMSLTGGENTPRQPSRNFTGVVTDRSMHTLAVTHMHCEGKTHVKAYLGEMRVELSFDKVARVEFGANDAGYISGVVSFRDGETKRLQFRGHTRCYGQSELGPMMIQLKDVKQIELGPPPPEEPEQAKP